MKIKYKPVRVILPHCGDCGERLLGNGSEVLPYQCKCGLWETRDWNNPMELSLKLRYE